MKKNILLFQLLFSTIFYGQLSYYSFTQTEETFTPITSTTVVLGANIDFGSSSLTNIGFDFVFDNVTYTQFSASPNGFIKLGSQAPQSTSTPISSSGVGPAIAFFARDGKTNGPVVYEVTGTIPNRVLTIEYPNYYVHWSSTVNTLSAQIKLYETSNKIEIVYGPSTRADGYTGQVGIVGTSTSNYSNRTTIDDWSNSVSGASNSDTMTWSSTVGPADGLTYTWTPPTCLPPTVLSASTISDVSADLNWTASTSNPSNNYEVYWSTSNIAPVLTTSPSATNVTSTYAASGLQPNTIYYWWVRSNCGGGDVSVWVSGGSFTTQIAVSAPYYEGFVTTSIPFGWLTAGWIIGSKRGATGNPGNNIYKNFYGTASTGNFTTVNVKNIANGMFLTFDYQFTNYNSPYLPPLAGSGTFNIEIATNFGSNYTSIGTINLDGVSGWRTFTYDVSPYAGQTIKIKISGVRTSGDWDAAFDNFKIDFPLCSIAHTWDGSTWSPSAPVANQIAVINGDYVGAGFEACELSVLGSSVVSITSGILQIKGVVQVDSGASLSLENNVNLVQEQNVTNIGNITVKRNSTPMIRLDYTAWSSPVMGQNLLNFSPNTILTRFYTYNEAGTSIPTAWISVADPANTNFVEGVGYLIRVDNYWSNTIASIYPGVFTGIPNNGDYSVSVPFTGSGFNLIGNPYPSTIDAFTFVNDNNVSNNPIVGVDALYFWTHATPASGGSYPVNNYASYTSGAGGVAAAGGGSQPNGEIQIGQGFIVHANGAGNILFNNAQRLTVNNGQFFRNILPSIERHRIWLNLNDATHNYNQILVGYIENATEFIDSGIDASLFSTSQTNLYSLINDKKYVIQGRSLPFDVNDEVPLGITIESEGNYTIALDHFDSFFENQDVYIWDKRVNIIHNLKLSSYTFSSEAGVFNSRFSLVYTSEVLSLENPFSTLDAIVYVQNGEIVIATGSELMKEVIVYDINGRKLLIQTAINSSHFRISKRVATNQIVLVEIRTTKNKILKRIKI